MKHMPYTINPFLPKVRMQAVMLVRSGWSMRKVSRYIGVNASTISRWCQKAPPKGSCGIATESSKPKTSPRKISDGVVNEILVERLKHGRCGNVVHQVLLNRGFDVSLSTVNRTLDRAGFLKKKSKWKRFHRNTQRPLPEAPGDLVQIDTIHIQPDVSNRDRSRIYIYTLIDVHSRWTYAKAVKRIGAQSSLEFLNEAKLLAPFKFNCIQSDNGPEFGSFFSQNSKVRHRHTRVRKPTDNAHLERFNRTIQDECIKYPTDDINLINSWIGTYLIYYNNHRLHMGINYLTPCQKLGLVLRRS